jgi:nitroreductase
MDFFAVIDRRQSVRAYQRSVVEPEKIETLLDTVRLAPSAGDLQAYVVVVVEDADTKQRLVRSAFGQSFIAQAPVVLVFCADPPRSEAKYGTRGAALFAIQDATIAAAHAQLAAVALGLASCWVGAFEERAVARSLGAPPHLRPVALLPLGYAAETPARTPRRRLEELVKRDRFA